MIDVVLFDLGGVLVELTGVATFSAWIEHRLTSEEIWHRWLSSPSVRAFETGRISADAFARQFITEFDLKLDNDQFLSAFAEWPRRAFPGAADLVRRVRTRRLCVTLCNTNVIHWRRFVEVMGLAPLFEHHFASHVIGKLKPDRDAFEHVLERLACAPGQVLFIDDQPLNVEAARRIGMTAFQARGVEEAEQVLVRAGILPATPM